MSTRMRVSCSEIWYIKMGEGEANRTWPWLGNGNGVSFIMNLLQASPSRLASSLVQLLFKVCKSPEHPFSEQQRAALTRQSVK